MKPATLLTPLATLILAAPLHAETLPATGRPPFDEGKKEHFWDDRAAITGEAKAPAGEKLLWYRKPAREWTEALPLGNGSLGAMIFGGVADERIQLNIDTLWDGAPMNADNPEALASLPEVRRLLFEGKAKQASDLAAKTMLGKPKNIKPYQTLGEIFLEAPGIEGASNYTRSLDLDTATAAVRYQSAGVTHTRESFASAVDDVIVTRFTASKPGSIDLKLTLKRLYDAKAVSDSAHPDTVFLEGHVAGGRDPDRLRFHAAVRAITEGGKTSSENGILTVSGADSVILFVAAATDYPGFGKGPADPSIDTKNLCVDTLDRAARKSFDDLKSAHIKEHHGYFHRSTLAMPSPAEVKALPTDERLASFKKGVPDPDLAALYYDYGKYLLIGSSRPGTMPANLQGIWNWQLWPAWSADFHSNINLQMNYWPAHLTGLSDCELPLIDLIESLMVPGARTAKSTYGARGWTVHHLTDAWGFTAPADGVWGVWPMGGPWLAAHPWQHYLFTQDKTFLRDRAWPIMRGSAEFILDFLVEAPAGSPVAGKLVTTPSHSPENAFILPDGTRSVFTYGATMDLQIIRELFENCIAADKSSTPMPPSAPSARTRLPASPRSASPAMAASWSGSTNTRKPIRNTATSRTSTACTPPTRSPPPPPSSSKPRASRSMSAAMAPPAGRSPGKSTSGPASTMATAPTSCSPICCATKPCPTSLTPTRRSRSTATSVPPPPLPRCSCKATSPTKMAAISSTSCPPCPAPGPKAPQKASAPAVPSPSISTGTTENSPPPASPPRTPANTPSAKAKKPPNSRSKPANPYASTPA
jgi:alpha-L-fucosidase 2